MTYLDQLNDEQQQAVLNVEGPLLVVAGAGSGKTRVITYRIAYLIDQLQVEPGRILAVTFTNKAAEEMRQRVAQLLHDRDLTTPPLISTFHSFCVRILRRHIEALQAGFSSNFSIYDDDESQRVMKAGLKQLRIDEKMLSVRAVQSAISRAKSRGLDAEAFLQQAKQAKDARLREGIARAFRFYEQRLRAANALDFDDLLLKTVELLRRNALVRDQYNRRFHHILIDEYQDTNRPQFDLVRLLTERRQSLCVVGDPDQSIYKFRGADIQNIIDFEKYYPTATVITLDQNYRSTQRILSVANTVIGHNRQRPDKSLRTENRLGKRICYYRAPRGEDEARFVVEEICRLLSNGRRSEQNPSRVAVLYRTNAQSRLFEEACRRHDMGFNIVGGFSFYKRAEIRDITAYLKLALNLWDDEAIQRIINTPPRGIGKKTFEAIQSIAREREISIWESLSLVIAERMMPTRSLAPLQQFKQMIQQLEAVAGSENLTTAVRAAMEETGYLQSLRDKAHSGADPLDAENRLMNLEELYTAAVEAEERGESLRDFVDHAALVSDADDYDQQAPITLMTMHGAKGLEFPVVFIVGLEEGLFPHVRARDDQAELEEERRLCYVAITRAQQQLYVTHAETRRIYGEESSTEPSRFLREMPLDQFEDLSWGSSSLLKNGKPVASKARPSPKPRRKFRGKTYNSVESLQEFFSQKGLVSDSKKSGAGKRLSERSGKFSPGSRVRHPKYGLGQVLKREGAGDQVKLTIQFPGYGVRKLMERAAQLEEA